MATRNALAVKIHTGAVDADFTNYCGSIPKVQFAQKGADNVLVVFTSDATTTDVSTAKNLMLNKFVETINVEVDA